MRLYEKDYIEKAKHRVSRIKEIIKITAEINKAKNIKTIEKIKPRVSQFFELTSWNVLQIFYLQLFQTDIFCVLFSSFILSFICGVMLERLSAFWEPGEAEFGLTRIYLHHSPSITFIVFAWILQLVNMKYVKIHVSFIPNVNSGR